MKLFKCAHCGNIISYFEDHGVKVVCCGEPMQEITANSVDAATEKHIPEVNVNGNTVEVVVGSVLHPMTEEHYITSIILETKNLSKFVEHVKFSDSLLNVVRKLETKNTRQRKELNPTDEPKATFAISDSDEVLRAYAYCNLHGLWVKEI